MFQKIILFFCLFFCANGYDHSRADELSLLHIRTEGHKRDGVNLNNGTINEYDRMVVKNHKVRRMFGYCIVLAMFVTIFCVLAYVMFGCSLDREAKDKYFKVICWAGVYFWSYGVLKLTTKSSMDPDAFPYPSEFIFLQRFVSSIIMIIVFFTNRHLFTKWDSLKTLPATHTLSLLFLIVLPSVIQGVMANRVLQYATLAFSTAVWYISMPFVYLVSVAAKLEQYSHVKFAVLLLVCVFSLLAARSDVHATKVGAVAAIIHELSFAVRLFACETLLKGESSIDVWSLMLLVVVLSAVFLMPLMLMVDYSFIIPILLDNWKVLLAGCLVSTLLIFSSINIQKNVMIFEFLMLQVMNTVLMFAFSYFVFGDELTYYEGGCYALAVNAWDVKIYRI